LLFASLSTRMKILKGKYFNLFCSLFY
jgi:hypothetical protein